LIFVKKVYIIGADFVGGHEINPINPARPRGFLIKIWLRWQTLYEFYNERFIQRFI
jgi:hypothetical protein